ncbi:hypothetical protein E8E12_010629 [Didymella heteroderae]|uniref:Uncharacterized protein n=1 Tax=Didymella heteroderae TaxID=1769908 RepID=A0A9P4WZ30_9PLEO|nr:hypothetical protein E8E12_010629 [Didymella heteroderae]
MFVVATGLKKLEIRTGKFHDAWEDVEPKMQYLFKRTALQLFEDGIDFSIQARHDGSILSTNFNPASVHRTYESLLFRGGGIRNPFKL